MDSNPASQSGPETWMKMLAEALQKQNILIQNQAEQHKEQMERRDEQHKVQMKKQEKFYEDYAEAKDQRNAANREHVTSLKLQSTLQSTTIKKLENENEIRTQHAIQRNQKIRDLEKEMSTHTKRNEKIADALIDKGGLFASSRCVKKISQIMIDPRTKRYKERKKQMEKDKQLRIKEIEMMEEEKELRKIEKKLRKEEKRKEGGLSLHNNTVYVS